MKTFRALTLCLFCVVNLRAAALQIVPGSYSSGKAYVTSVFDGARARCFLDTGSAMTLVADSKRFGNYTNLGPFKFKSASGIAQEIQTIRIGLIQIDDQSFENVRIGRADFRGAENTLGIDILGRQPFALKFKSRTQLQLNAPRPELPLTTLNVSPQGLLTIPVDLNGTEVAALWDTGAALTTLDQNYIAAHPEDFKPTKTYMRGVDGAGKTMLVQVFRAKKITVADRKFEDVRVVAVNLSLLRENLGQETHAVIGFNLIRKSNWFFDTKNRLWNCERN